MKNIILTLESIALLIVSILLILNLNSPIQPAIALQTQTESTFLPKAEFFQDLNRESQHALSETLYENAELKIKLDLCEKANQ